MLDRIGNMVDAATGLAQSRARLVMLDLQRAGLIAVAYFVVGAVVVAGGMTLLAALAVMLAPTIGWASALAVVGGVQLIVAGGGLGYLMLRQRRTAADRAKARREIVKAQETLSSAGDDEGNESGGNRPDIAGAAEQTLRSLLEDPKLVASGVFAAISLLGVGRAVRMLGGIATGASIAASLMKSWSAVSAGQNGSTAQQKGSHRARSNGVSSK